MADRCMDWNQDLGAQQDADHDGDIGRTEIPDEGDVRKVPVRWWGSCQFGSDQFFNEKRVRANLTIGEDDWPVVRSGCHE